MLIDSIANDSFGASDSNGLEITNFDQNKNSNKVLQLLDKADDTTINSHLSENIMNTDSYDTPLSKHRNSSASVGIINYNAVCWKISIIFSVCCIIGFFLMPIIFYFVNQTRQSTEVGNESSYEKNTSNKEVCKPGS